MFVNTPGKCQADGRYLREALSSMTVIASYPPQTLPVKLLARTVLEHAKFYIRTMVNIRFTNPVNDGPYMV